MRSALTLVAIAVLGLFGATSIGYAAYVVSRNSVGLPVTKLKLSPNKLAPVRAKTKASKPKPGTTGAVTPPPPSPPSGTTTGDDYGGRPSGKGSGDSHGGSDD